MNESVKQTEAIMSMTKKIAEGLLFIADVCVEERKYIYPSESRRADDVARLSSDVRVVGNDMKKAISKHGKRAYQLTGN